VDLQELQPEKHIALLTDRPVFLIHGKNDGTTSYADSLRLQEQTNGKAEVWIVEGAGHLQALAHPEYFSRIKRFLQGTGNKVPASKLSSERVN